MIAIGRVRVSCAVSYTLQASIGGHNLVKLTRNILGYSWVAKYRGDDPRAPALRAYPENTTQSEVFSKPRPWQLKRPLKDSLIVVPETSSHLPASAR